MNRVRSREVVMELFYQMDIHNEYEGVFAERMFNQYEEELLDSEYIKNLVKLFLENKSDVDTKIESHLKGWKVERLAKLDLAILRMSVSELSYMPEVPKKVSINEAVKIAQKYVDEKSGKFINGVLSHFADEA